MKFLTFSRLLVEATCGLLLVLASCMALPANAQMIGFTAELDSMLWETESSDDVLSDLAYYGVYHVYANFTNPTDVLGAVYADVVALGTPPMGIDAPCGCNNPAMTSIAVDASNNPGFFAAFPEYQFDSFWTIGMTTSQDAGQLPSHIGMGQPGDLCSGLNIENGTVYIIGETGDWPVNAVAGDDLRVLIARVTTCSDFTIQACAQVFLAGDQNDVQQFCPDALEVLHEGCTDLGACNYNPNATTDDGNCEFDDGIYGCDGECISDIDGDGVCDPNEIPGCTDAGACNFNELATDEDDSCEYVSCAGCTEVSACNFDQTATIEDNSCFFPGEVCDDMNALTEGDVYQADCSCQGYSCFDETACNFSTDGIEDNGLCSYISQYDVVGNADPYSQTLQVYTYTSTAGSTYNWTIVGGDILDGNGTNELSVVWNVGGAGSVCVTETNADGCSGNQECLIVDVNLSSVMEVLDGTLDVFPIPASETLNLVWKGPTIDNAFVTLRDAAGRVVRAMQVGERDVLDVGALGPGSYMLEFTVPARGSIDRRILIQ